jgi:hypothetical protein
MLKKGEKINNRLNIICIYIGTVIHIFPQGGGGHVYLLEDEVSKERFILKCSAFPSDSTVPNMKESEEQMEKRK